MSVPGMYVVGYFGVFQCRLGCYGIFVLLCPSVELHSLPSAPSEGQAVQLVISKERNQNSLGMNELIPIPFHIEWTNCMRKFWF